MNDIVIVIAHAKSETLLDVKLWEIIRGRLYFSVQVHDILFNHEEV